MNYITDLDDDRSPVCGQPLSEIMLAYWYYSWEQISWTFIGKCKHLCAKKIDLKIPSAKCHIMTRPQCVNQVKHKACFPLAIDSFTDSLHSVTHWGRDKMDAISQRRLWNAFLWMKMLDFGLKFHWSPIKKYSIIGSDNGLAPCRRQAIIWTNDSLFTDAYMRHSASVS